MEPQASRVQPPGTAQSSIKSFFQPRTPSYTAPPNQSIAKEPSRPPVTPQPQPQAVLAVSHPSLPPQATISTIQGRHVQPLRRINSLLLPVNYPDNFYHRLLSPGETQPIFSRIILWRDAPSKSTPADSEPKVIGGVVCRVEPDEGADTSSIYIQSLALLSPYRSYGLATTVLEDIITHATSRAPEGLKISSLYAHVWTHNEEGLEWYAKRGFAKEEPVLHGYYHRLQPDSAWVLRRALRPSDHLRQQTLGSTIVPDATPSAAAAPTTTSKSGPQASLLRPNPPPAVRAASYQSMRPATEWNDLPLDILAPSRSNTPSQRPSPSSSSANLLEPPGAMAERSASQTRSGKKKRQYPTAAFGPATS